MDYILEYIRSEMPNRRDIDAFDKFKVKIDKMLISADLIDKKILIERFIDEVNYIENNIGIHFEEFDNQFFNSTNKTIYCEIDKIVKEENLKLEATLKYFNMSLKNNFISQEGQYFANIVNLNPFDTDTHSQMFRIFEKLKSIFDKYKGLVKEVQKLENE